MKLIVLEFVTGVRDAKSWKKNQSDYPEENLLKQVMEKKVRKLFRQTADQY